MDYYFNTRIPLSFTYIEIKFKFKKGVKKNKLITHK